jgi:hypothetical protein
LQRLSRFSSRSAWHAKVRHRSRAVESVDDTIARLRATGADLVGKVAQYEDKYRLCYIRGQRASSWRWRRNCPEAGRVTYEMIRQRSGRTRKT